MMTSSYRELSIQSNLPMRGEILAVQIVELRTRICYYYSRRLFHRKVYKYLCQTPDTSVECQDTERAQGDGEDEHQRVQAHQTCCQEDRMQGEAAEENGPAVCF